MSRQHKTFIHKLIRIIGGTYTENDWSYYYKGKLRGWVELLSFNINKWITLKMYDYKIYKLKNKIKMSNNQGRPPQQEEDSRFLMAYCLLGTIIVLALYAVICAI